MTLPFAYLNDLQYDGPVFDSGCGETTTASHFSGQLYVIEEKISVPKTTARKPDIRLATLLKHSVNTYPATLLCGRTGTGKTSAAVRFAKKFERASWFTIDSSDIQWQAFSMHLAASLRQFRGDADVGMKYPEISRSAISHFIDSVLVDLVSSQDKAQLIVFDDLHQVFDALWFRDLFDLLLNSLQPGLHLLMLCRSKPPVPLWRLRSKQQLNLIDENAFA